MRRQPSSNLVALLEIAARIAMIATGLVVGVTGLYFGQLFLAPVALAIVIGLMFGPAADRIEKAGTPAYLSAGIVMLAFLVLIASALTAFAVPLSAWMHELPRIWQNLRAMLVDWSGFLDTIGQVQDQLKLAVGDEANVKVEVEGSSTATDIAFLAPAIIGQIVIFLASMYFFIATRHRIRISILKMCIDRRLRWRVARVFRDAEWLVSRYLLSITFVNIGLGVAVGIAMALLGVRSPILWGMLAAVLNYILYVGPAVMAILLLGVGLATFTGPAVLLPPAVFLGLNLVEAQFVTPHIVSRSVVMNPFILFLSIVFWLWLWGPVGGLVAVPILLVSYAVLTNILPGYVIENQPGRVRR